MAFLSLDIFLGPPGSGKDTQAKLLVQRLGYHILPIGDLIRAYAKTNTKVDQEMKKGELADNEVINEIVQQQLEQHSSTDRVLSDGFPRNLSQAEWLMAYLQKNHQAVSHVFWLKLSRGEAQARLQKRGRADDAAALVDHRYDIYEAQTVPVVEYFKRQNLVTTVDADNDIETIYQAIVKVLGA